MGACALCSAFGDLTQVIAAGDAVGRGAHFLHRGTNSAMRTPMMRETSSSIK